MFKKILAYALTVCLLLSFTVPASAADEVYSVTDDTTVISPAIYYTEGYYPGLVAELRNSLTFANSNIAHGSYSSGNYSPTYSYRNGSLFNLDLPLYYPSVIADHSDVSAVATVPNTSLVSGSLLTVKLPASNDAYFDFQSSNFLFDQQSPDANTFYVNGDLTFNLRNLWSFSGSPSSDSFYLASDPLAVQLLIDGKPYGDIIDVTGYTSPFTSLYGGAVPANATVHFDNMKVYYQGDTPDMIGFRVLTGSAFTDGSYLYNDGGDFTSVSITNTVTFRCSEIPDITFVQEGGDGYAGDLSGISGLLSDISVLLSSLKRYFYIDSLNPLFLNAGGGESSWQDYPSLTFLVHEGLRGIGSLLRTFSSNLRFYLLRTSGYYLSRDANINVITTDPKPIHELVAEGFLGLRYLMVDGGGTSLLSRIYMSLENHADFVEPLLVDGNGVSWFRDIFYNQLASQSYVADTVFPWQSYNMQTHELNAATNITGQNNLFFTAFQSIEDKLGRLAYVFGSDEDLALKDSADPGTDAFRENFGGGASLSDIKDASELTTTIPQIMDSGFDFGDALEEIGSNDDFLKWFTSETWAALDSTGAAVAADPDYLSDYYDNLRKVEEKRHWGD